MSRFRDSVLGPARLEALAATALLDAPPDAELERLTALARRLTGAAVAMVSLVDRDRHFLASGHGLPPALRARRELPLGAVSFCQAVVDARAPVVVPDTRDHALGRDNAQVVALGAGAYLGAPVLVGGQHAVGALALLDFAPRRWTDEEVDLVRDLAASASGRLDLRVSSRSLAQAELTRGALADQARLLDRISDGFFAVDRQWRWTYLNAPARAFFELLLGGPRELVGEVLWDALPAFVGSTFWHEYHRALREQVMVTFEEFCPPTRRWLEVRAFPDAAGLSVYFRDVTGAREAQEALRQSEQRFETTFERAPVGITHTALDGRWLRVNERMCEIVGYRREELQAMAFREITHPDDVTKDLDVLAELRSGARSRYQTEKRYIHKDGHVVWAALTVSSVRDQAGRPLYFVAVVEDITRRKHAEQALIETRRELERRVEERTAELERRRVFLEAVEQATLAGVAAVDHEGRQTYVNPAFCRMLGFAAEELLGATAPFAYWPREEHAAIEQAFALTLTGRAPAAGFELRFARKDGTRFPVHVLVAPLRGGDGRPSGWLASVYDLTEHKRAEEERAQLYREQVARAEAEAAARKHSFLARAGEVLAGSLDWEQTLSTVAELAVPYFADWCIVDLHATGSRRRTSVAAADPDKREALRALLREHPPAASSPQPGPRVMREGRPLFLPGVSEEALAAWADDERQLALVRRLAPRSVVAVPLELRGEMLGAITFAVAESGRAYGPDDVELAEDLGRRVALAVENARLYAEAKAARAEAETASRVKDEFLAMLGHELRNPLAPILTALEIMRLKDDGRSGREQEVIARQVQHLVRLVDDLLDVSRLARGQIELRKERVELAAVVAKAIEMASPLLESRAHALDIQVPASGLAVEGDQARLAQVVANLLTNAAKYTDRRGHVTLAAAREGERIRLDVRDDGMGIRADLLPRIFDLFFQADRSLDRRDGGLGIGLTLVKSLVRMHGGEVSAASEGPGRGSTFTVLLPAAPGPALGPTPPGWLLRGPAPASVRRRVLVVDDNADAALTLTEALRALGHEVAVAHDGPQALATFAEFQPEAALLDIGLPVMDGYELARRLRQEPPARGIWMAALTGYGQEQDVARSRQAGFDAHYVKPIDLETLAAALASLPPR